MTNNYSIQSTINNVVSGQQETLFLPGKIRPGAHGVMLLHGSGANYSMFSEAARWASSELAACLTLAGFPCLSIQMGGSLYANDVTMDNIEAGIEYLSEAAGVPADKVHLLGVSMGGGTALRFASLNPERALSVTGLIPMVNIIHAYENNVLGLRAAIGTAWGVTYPTPLPEGADLLSLAAAIAENSIATQLWYDDVDAVIRPVDVLAMAEATNADLREIEATDLGHSESSIKTVVDTGAGRAIEIINHLVAAEGA